MDGDAFRVYVCHVLAPTPRRGDVVILNNLPAQNVASHPRGDRRWPRPALLPALNSPDMDPIEMAFAKLKALLQQQPASTVDALIERIGQFLDRFLPTECVNLFHAAGYQHSIGKCSGSVP